MDALAQYEGPLLRYAAWIVRDPEIGRDIVQETFLRLCREDETRLQGHVAQWLFTVCRNLGFDTRKREARMTPLEDTEVGVQSNLEERQTVGEIFRLLEKLPKNQREVAYLKFQCDLSYKEISEITKLSVGNVGLLIHTALKAIRKQVVTEPARRNK